MLTTGHALAAVMALAIIFLPLTVLALAGICILGGGCVAMEETLGDSLCAELAGEKRPVMALGTLATVRGVGDSLSNMVVGTLRTAFGMSVAFGYSPVLFAAGALLVWKLHPEI